MKAKEHHCFLLPIDMIYQVDNVSVGDVITLSFNDYPNWQVEIDGVNVPKNPNQNFIQVNSTKSGTITIDYSWVAAPIEAQAQYLQIGLLICSNSDVNHFIS